jgi:glutathione S-transferase
MAYELFYWDGLQGRGEFIRLALEMAQADYRDVSRSDAAAVQAFINDPTVTTPTFAPPVLRDGDVIVGQTAALLLYLGPRLGLVSDDERLALWTHQIQLTVADLVSEAHDSHHPIGVGHYYEDQKTEALLRADEFRNQRMPKFLRWFETILKRNPSGPQWLVGDTLSYVDLSLFQLVEGLRYAFPNASAALLTDYPNVVALHDRVAALPQIKAYVQSDRRTPLNQHDIFRHYPELDSTPN